MNTTDLCALYAPLIAIVVSLAHKIPFVGTNPKVIAFLLAIIANGFSTFATGAAIHTAQLVACILASFAGSVATYEVALKPLAPKVAP